MCDTLLYEPARSVQPSSLFGKLTIQVLADLKSIQCGEIGYFLKQSTRHELTKGRRAFEHSFGHLKGSLSGSRPRPVMTSCTQFLTVLAMPNSVVYRVGLRVASQP